MLLDIADKIATCKACPLHKERTRTVPGVGPLNPPVLFIGEGPGKDEDETGLPFVGRAGKLLTQMIESIGLRREQVFIANVVKCRPPNNRTPTQEECESCLPFLDSQVELIKPQTICLLGSTACQALLGHKLSMREFREGNTWQGSIICTYHPAYLLRNEDAKVEAWKDLKKLKELINGV